MNKTKAKKILKKAKKLAKTKTENELFEMLGKATIKEKKRGLK
jgi:hypothetical protein